MSVPATKRQRSLPMTPVPSESDDKLRTRSPSQSQQPRKEKLCTSSSGSHVIALPTASQINKRPLQNQERRVVKGSRENGLKDAFFFPVRQRKLRRLEPAFYAVNAIENEEAMGNDDVIEDDSSDQNFKQSLPNELCTEEYSCCNDQNDHSMSITDQISSEGLSQIQLLYPALTPYSQCSSHQSKKNSRHDSLSFPWVELFPPTTMNELAVNKRKVFDVEKWIKEAFRYKDERKILVLTGPSGSGKSTTIKILSKVYGYEITEWKYIPRAGSSKDCNKSPFEEFLMRSDQFGTLTFKEDEKALAQRQRTSITGNDRRLILIEEFPSFRDHTSSNLRSFRSSLHNYMKSSRTPRHCYSATVLVISETLLGSTGSQSNNITVQGLLGPELICHPGVTIIEFNPVAPTFVQKALELVLEKERIHSLRPNNYVESATLKQLANIGDLRNAISSLEFMCLLGQPSGKENIHISENRLVKRSHRKNPTPLGSHESLAQRESSLGIFHAAGKVLYNKRGRTSRTLPNPPSYLQSYSRDLPSEVSVDNLMGEIGTDIQTFIATLHENYVPSCEGLLFSRHLEDCIMCLSDSDVLCFDIYERQQRRYFDKSRSVHRNLSQDKFDLDCLLQGEIGFNIAVRGLLFSLPHPVKRGGNDNKQPNKILFPASQKLWKDAEYLCSCIRYWTWNSRVPDFTSLSEQSLSKHNVAMPHEDKNFVTRPLASPVETLLDYIPFEYFIPYNIFSELFPSRTATNEQGDADKNSGKELLRRLKPSLIHKSNDASETLPGNRKSNIGILHCDNIED